MLALSFVQFLSWGLLQNRMTDMMNLTMAAQAIGTDWTASEFLDKPASRKNGFRIAPLGPEKNGFLVKFPRASKVVIKEFPVENADSQFRLNLLYKIPEVKDEVTGFVDFVEDKVNSTLVHNASEWRNGASGGTGGSGGKKGKKQQGEKEKEGEQSMLRDLLKSAMSSLYYINDRETLFVHGSVLPRYTEFYDEEGKEVSLEQFMEKLDAAQNGRVDVPFYSAVPALNFSHVWCDGQVRNGIKVKVAAVRLHKPSPQDVEIFALNGSPDGNSNKRQKVGGVSLA